LYPRRVWIGDHRCHHHGQDLLDRRDLHVPSLTTLVSCPSPTPLTIWFQIPLDHRTDGARAAFALVSSCDLIHTRMSFEF
jgi:hypothetical protein